MKSIAERHKWFDSSKLLDAFFITSSEYAKYKDWYIQVKEKSLKIYDS